MGVVDTKDGSKNQTLVNDASGKILQRVQDGKTTRSLIVNGELLGTTGPTVGADDFSPSFRPIDGGNPQASPGSYRIQPGDTLQTIAQQAYGDSRLWFLVAEANGLASDRDLRVGATVTIPNRVSGNHNDYKTFKPYDPGKLIGDTQPTMPVPEADGGGGCGGFGSLILAVVAVVATVFTAGALAPAAFATSAAAAAGTTTALGATLAAGSSVLLGGAGFAASVGIGLAAGAVGSIVSQGVGMAMGMQSKFSWSGVALGGLTTAVSAGVANSFGGAAAIQGTLGQKMLEVAGRAVVSSTISQGISMAVGLQSKFSWSGVAAAGVGAAVGYGISDTAFRGWNGPGSQLVRSAVAGTGAGVVATVLSGGKANYVQIATDAFGNALGNSVVTALEQSGRGLTTLQAKNSGFDSDGAYNQIVEAFSAPRPMYAANGFPVLLAANEPALSGRLGATTDVSGGRDDGGYPYERTYQNSDGVVRVEASRTPFDDIAESYNRDGSLELSLSPEFALNNDQRSALANGYGPLTQAAAAGTRSAAFGAFEPSFKSVSSPTIQGFFDNSFGNRLIDEAGRKEYIRTTGENSVDVLKRVSEGVVSVREGAYEAVAFRDGETLRIRQTSTSPEMLRNISVTRPDKTTEVVIERNSSTEALHRYVDQKLFPYTQEKLISKGLDAQVDDVYREIIESSGRPNAVATQKAFDRVKIAGIVRSVGTTVGRVATVVGVASDTVSFGSEVRDSVRTGNFDNTYREGGRIAAGWTAAWRVGRVGATVGAALGGAFGTAVPVVGNVLGVAIGGVVGGLIGGASGYWAGSRLSIELYDWIKK